MKTAMLTPRDVEILRTATHYTVKCGHRRQFFDTIEDAQQWGVTASAEDPIGRGAVLYAVGFASGVDASALIGSLKNGKWTMFEPEPENKKDIENRKYMSNSPDYEHRPLGEHSGRAI